MTSLQYKLKTFNTILNGKNESPSKNDHLNMDHWIACNDEYLISYENDPLSSNNNNAASLIFTSLCYIIKYIFIYRNNVF